MLRSTLLASVLLILGVGSALADDAETRWMMMEDEHGNSQSVVISGNVDYDSRAVILRENVTFILYTLGNDATGGVRIYVDEPETITDFNPQNPTKILIHGFWGDITSSVIQLLRAGYFANGFDYNIIGVDWGVLCPSPFYNVAKNNSLLVGPYVGDLINFLVGEGAALSDIHLVGHSLGGQVVGMAGSNVAGGQRVARISGMDPALPLFDVETDDHRLDPTDAVVVDVIHTDGGGLGFLTPIGHIDFYPNGGRAPQPGCGADITGQCSHTRNYLWYAATIPVVNNTLYPARACATLADAMAGTCDAEFTGYMGDNLGATPNGLYYLQP